MSQEEYNKFFKDQIEFLKTLDKRYLKSIRLYTEESFIILNSILASLEIPIATRLPDGVLNDKLQEIYECLIYIFENIPPISEKIKVYRGIADVEDDPKNIIKNLTRRFVSTSTQEEVVEDFIGGDCCKLIISIPKGSKVIPASPYSQSPEELEVLLPPGGEYKLLSKKQDDNDMIIYNINYKESKII